MTSLENILAEIKQKTAGFNPASYQGFLAVQVTLKDIDKVFYVEIKDGALTVEPYSYNDRQANMIISSDNFVKLINNKLNSVQAFLTGKLKIEGSIEKVKEMAAVFGAATD
ncbi:MAG: SCP2 sterol-binding domain-containing protein [Oscillospiraceae bacterium]|nr:SCP2 sterol-binding domain-containing protein [Oscillospiraceae bacterium]